MELPIDDKEFAYIVTALWKCRKNVGEPECKDLYENVWRSEIFFVYLWYK